MKKEDLIVEECKDPPSIAVQAISSQAENLVLPG
jgi:hypothetical protein